MIGERDYSTDKGAIFSSGIHYVTNENWPSTQEECAGPLARSKGVIEPSRFGSNVAYARGSGR